ncbi:solute carrier family 26 protein [Myxococcota bacterium]|nr:solute carrier family 26 protein [Myxococcota bacterium]MBU1897109.1 solute carrier family 26 protein [Myxococcota bacterium]
MSAILLDLQAFFFTARFVLIRPKKQRHRSTPQGALIVFDWLKHYKRADLRGDLTAGLTTAVMLVPQAMAYAILADLPPIIGLYASVIPLILYALLGTSRQLAVGPVAMVSLLVASGIGPLAQGDPATAVGLAALLALMVGALQLGMGLGRMGFLVNFLSHPVISGFTSAAALVIGLSQLKYLLGIKLDRTHRVDLLLHQAYTKLDQIQVEALILGGGAILILLALRKWAPKVPGALIVVILGTIIAKLELLKGLAIVGEVPAGLPAPSVPIIDSESLIALLPIALTIAMVGFMESISVAKAFARRNRYKVDPNQELIALGAANLGGSVFGAYPVTGGFSRTAVNAQAGANTGLASIITGLFVLITLQFLTEYFFFLPKAVLSAIIMVAVFGLIDIKEVKHLWHVKKSDLVFLVITFFSTLILGIEEGILVGVASSVFWFFVMAIRPHFAVLGRLPNSDVFRNVSNYPEAETRPEVLAVRMDAPFFFGNATFLQATLERLEAERGGQLKRIIIDASSINDLDSSAESMLRTIAEELRGRGIELAFAAVKGPVRAVMDRAGFTAFLGRDRFYHDVKDAMDDATPSAAAA